MLCLWSHIGRWDRAWVGISHRGWVVGISHRGWVVGTSHRNGVVGASHRGAVDTIFSGGVLDTIYSGVRVGTTNMAFSKVCSLYSQLSSLCCRDALSWRSVFITSLNLAFSSLRARLRLTRAAWLLATWAYECVASSAVVGWPACLLASGSGQRVSACMRSASFSVMNTGHSLLAAEWAPSQFGHFP